METLSEIHSRTISYIEFSTENNWFDLLPRGNWCLVIIADNDNKHYFDEIIRKSIDRDVGYIIGTCKNADLIHTMADDEIQFRDVDIEDHYLPRHVILTVSEKVFEEGIWDSIYTAHNDENEIKEVVIVDITGKWRAATIILIEKFKSGYLPPG